MPQYNPRQPEPNQFCWLEPVKQACLNQPYGGDQSPARAGITFTTTTGGAFTLILIYTQVNSDGIPIGQTLERRHTITAGPTKQTKLITNDLAALLWCSGGRISLTVTADLPNSPTSGPVYISNNPPCLR